MVIFIFVLVNNLIMNRRNFNKNFGLVISLVGMGVLNVCVLFIEED